MTLFIKDILSESNSKNVKLLSAEKTFIKLYINILYNLVLYLMNTTELLTAHFDAEQAAQKEQIKMFALLAEQLCTIVDMIEIYI